MNDPAVQVRSLCFDYAGGADFSANGQAAKSLASLYERFDAAFAAASLVAVMGGSGSGKSTLARLLAGLLRAIAGDVVWDKDFAAPHDIVYVDQDPKDCLFPWQRVRENLLWPLKQLGWPEARREARADELLRFFRLEAHAEKYPSRLSGGQLQRLGVARCLSWQPRAMIFDESFSALDRALKEELLPGLRQLLREQRTTAILITHNLTDVLAFADRCIILGDRPVRALADEHIDLPDPRNENSADYRAAQDRLIEVLRHGYL